MISVKLGKPKLQLHLKITLKTYYFVRITTQVTVSDRGDYCAILLFPGITGARMVCLHGYQAKQAETS